VASFTVDGAADPLTQPRGVDPVHARRHHQHGLAVEQEDERVGDRAHVDAESRRRLGGRLGGTVEPHDLRHDAGVGERRLHAHDRGMLRQGAPPPRRR
jgi:hypothetical protein